MQQRNFFTGEFCLAGADLMGPKGEVFAVENGRLQIMAYDPGKVDTPHSVRALGDGITPASDIHRVWVGEGQLRKDPTQVGVRPPGMA
jgi:hypothetical protein